MADPLGHLLSRALFGWFGYRMGEAKERNREIALLEREKLKNERERLRQEAAHERERVKEEARQQRARLQHEFTKLNDERINAIANRVYARLYAHLAKVQIGTKSQKFYLKDLLGEPELARFALEIAEEARKELKQQP